MTTLRRKVLVLVSAIVVALAIVVLPGCGKKEPAPAGKTPAKETSKTKAMKDME